MAGGITHCRQPLGALCSPKSRPTILPTPSATSLGHEHSCPHPANASQAQVGLGGRHMAENWATSNEDLNLFLPPRHSHKVIPSMGPHGEGCRQRPKGRTERGGSSCCPPALAPSTGPSNRGSIRSRGGGCQTDALGEDIYLEGEPSGE